MTLAQAVRKYNLVKERSDHVAQCLRNLAKNLSPPKHHVEHPGRASVSTQLIAMAEHLEEEE